MTIGLLAACGLPSSTADPAAALKDAEVDGQALELHALTGGERQAALMGDAFAEAFASQQVDIDRLTVLSAVGPRISVLAISSPSLAAVDRKEEYIHTLVNSPDTTFGEVRPLTLGAKEVTAVEANIEGCTEPCVDNVVVYPTGSTVFIIQVDVVNRAGELLAQLP